MKYLQERYFAVLSMVEETNDALVELMADFEDEIDKILLPKHNQTNNMRMSRPNEIIFDTLFKISKEDIDKICEKTGLIADYYSISASRMSYNIETDRAFSQADYGGEYEYHFFYEIEEDDECECTCCCCD